MPLQEDEIDNSVQNALAAANAVIQGLNGFCLPAPEVFTFQCSQLSEKYTADLLKSVPTGHGRESYSTDFIYVFKLITMNKEYTVNLNRLFIEARDLQNSTDYEGKKDYCKNNESKSTYLYVGRSKKLRSRLSQHLGAKHEGIYAMHLQRWATQLNCEIEVSYYSLDGQPNLVVQSIEDGIWETVTPMFGRQGEQ